MEPCRLNALLIDAIERKAPALVTGMLDMGAEANHTVHLPLLTDAKAVPKISSSFAGAYATPLHVAVLNYLAYTRPKSSSVVKDALQIVEILLKYGADTNMTSTDLSVWNATSSRFDVPGGTALETAIFVNDRMLRWEGEWFTRQLVDVLRLSVDTISPLIVPTVTVSSAVYQRWRATLTEGTFSDLTFVCADGKEVTAHMSVLTHASEYFRRLLEGPWMDTTRSMHPDVPVEVMRGILSHVYTGEIDVDVVARHPADVLRLSQEYMLSDLEALADAYLARNVTLENLETLLVLSEIHRASELKRSCIKFVCSNKATALTRMMHLATTNPDLWVQLVTCASADEPVHKKLRAS